MARLSQYPQDTSTSSAFYYFLSEYSYFLGYKQNIADNVVELSDLRAPDRTCPTDDFAELVKNYLTANPTKTIISYIPTNDIVCWTLWREVLEKSGFTKISLGINKKTNREILLYYYVGKDFIGLGKIRQYHCGDIPLAVRSAGCCMIQCIARGSKESPKINKWSDKEIVGELQTIKLHDNFYMALDKNPHYGERDE